MPHFQHETALVETLHIGQDTRIWAYAHILPGARIGRDCNICDHTFIENDVVVGDRVTVKCGVQLWDGLRVEDRPRLLLRDAVDAHAERPRAVAPECRLL